MPEKGRRRWHRKSLVERGNDKTEKKLKKDVSYKEGKGSNSYADRQTGE